MARPDSLIAAALLSALALGAEAEMSTGPERYDVVWTSPSKNSSGSMPLGNGDIGLNAWVEEGGDLLFYISKTDAWSGNGRLLKLGRVRVKLSPNPFTKGAPFEQALRLRGGEIVIRAGEGAAATAIRVWVDANRPLIRVESENPRGHTVQVGLELWRTEPRQLKGQELHSAYGMSRAPHTVIVHPDTVVPNQRDRIVWYHRNERSIWPETLKVQGLEAFMKEGKDPLLHRTFGGLIRAKGLTATSPTRLEMHGDGMSSRQVVSIHILTAQTPTPEDWVRQVEKLAAANESVDLEAARAAHRTWWEEFWGRSWIHVSGAAAGGAITTNTLPLRIGADSNGQNRFRGRIRRARVFARALTPAEVRKLAADPAASLEDAALVGDWTFDEPKNGQFANAAAPASPAKVVGDVKIVDGPKGRCVELAGKGYLEVADHPKLDLTRACTLAAWIAPERLGGGGARILDKSRAATANGYLLDTFPGNSLRLIVEAGILIHKADLTAGEWVHVAATYDAGTGQQRLFVNGRQVAEQAVGAKVSQIAQGYALQRFIQACAGRGNSPIKFNGTIFTVDARHGKEQFDADYRRWGGPYWFQNTRLAYWPMLASGDSEMMLSLFRMYMEALPLARARTRTYFGHDGACFPETMYFWGAYANDNFGWNRQGKPVSHCDNTYIRHYWDGALELAMLMLDYHAHTGDDAFLKSTLLPLAEPIIAFYDRHYPRDPDGKLRLEPSQALETWQKAINPLPPIAGLHVALDRLLALPEGIIPAEQRQAWQRLRGELPDVPKKQADGGAILLPAGKILQGARNSENPELYAIFPYRLYGVGKPDIEVGRATFARRRVKRTGGWTQDPIQAALLGLADVASRYTAQNFARKDPGSRFPAFWGPNFDWIPDQDHGSVALIALQTMLMQTEGRKILLFPAWPKGWDADFKLHAPRRTTVEGTYRAGKLGRLVVVPEARRKDLVILDPQ